MTDIKDKKIVLIGGAGFIGHNLAIHLRELGAEVSVIDGLQVNNFLSFSTMSQGVSNPLLCRKITSRRLDLLENSGVHVYVQDAREYSALSEILAGIKPQVIIQLAAVSHANRSNKNPHSTFDHSLRTLENALDCAKGHVEQFIYFSSSMVYGNFKEKSVQEDSHCEPLGIYGALKLSGEMIVKAYNQVFGLPYTIIRPSALYGERCVSRRVGQIFIENALTGKEISINGDGSDRLDFTYIKDLVHGVACAVQSKNAINQTFNLTYGSSRTISEMIDILKRNFPEVSINYKPKDKLTPDRGTLCIDKAKELIGYSPSYPLDKGYVEYINWYKKYWESIQLAK